MGTKFFFKTTVMAYAMLLMCFTLKAQTQTAPLVEWANEWNVGPSGNSNWILDVKATSDKGYIAAGYSTTSSGDRYPIIMKINGKGQMVWNQWFNSGTWPSGGDFWEVIEGQDASGADCYVAMGYVGSGSSKKPFIVQTDPDGNVTNGPFELDVTGTYSTSSIKMYGLAYDPTPATGGYVAVGYIESTVPYQVFVQKFGFSVTSTPDEFALSSTTGNYLSISARSVCCIYNSSSSVVSYALTGTASTSSTYSAHNSADAYVCTFTISGGTLTRTVEKYYDFGNNGTYTPSPGTALTYCNQCGVGDYSSAVYVGTTYGPSYDMGTKILQISNGGDIVVGTSANYYYGGYSSGGSTDWHNLPSVASGMVDNWVDGDGAILKLSYNFSTPSLSVVNLTADGGTYGAVRMAHFSGEDFTIVTRVDTKDNTLIMAGSNGDDHRPPNYLTEEASGEIVKADLDANVIWSRYIKDPWYGLCGFSVCVDADGNYVTAGTAISSGGYTSDFHYIVKLQDETNFDCRQNFYDWTFENGVIINSSTVWSPTSSPGFKVGQSDIFVKGTIEIKPGATLELNGLTLEFADPRDYVDVDDATAYPGLYIPGILVDPGASLYIHNSILKPLSSFGLMGNSGGSSCTPGLWDGIELLGNIGVFTRPTNTIAYYSTPPSPTEGTVYIDDNSVISGARIGITVGDGWAQDGGLISAQDAKFQDCYRAVAYYSYPYSNNSKFTNCTFIWDQALPQTGNWGFNTLFSMDGVTGIGFDECTFANTVLPGTINGHQRGTGIGALDAVFNLPSAGLPTYEVSGVPGCYSYAPPPPRNYFFGLDKGIVSNKGTGSPNANIAYSWFYNCVDAMYLDQNTDPQVIENEVYYDNEIDLSATGYAYQFLPPTMQGLIDVVDGGTGGGSSTGGINNVYDYLSPDNFGIGYGITISNTNNFYLVQNHVHSYLTDNTSNSRQLLVPNVSSIYNGIVTAVYLLNDQADAWQPLAWENTVDNHKTPWISGSGDADVIGWWFDGTTQEINVADNTDLNLDYDWLISANNFTLSIDPSTGNYDGYNIFTSTPSSYNIFFSGPGTFQYNWHTGSGSSYDPTVVNSLTNVTANGWTDFNSYITGTLGYSIECGSTLPTGPESKQVHQITDASITIFPNPMTDLANLTWQLPENCNEATLTVYDNLGRLCQAIPLNGNAGTGQILADNLAGGIYAYRMTGGGNEMKQGKFIVTQH